MGGRSRFGLLAAILFALVLGVLATWGPPRPLEATPGTFAFAALGDAPYYPWEDLQYRIVLRDLEAHDLAFVLHVGDIFWHPCTEEMYRRSLGWFDGLGHPVVLTPGDNEWTDCWEPGSGSYAPLERLDVLRRLFFADPARSLGRPALALERQGGREPFPQLVENARWEHAGFLFATVHLVGSRNGLKPFPGRGAADDDDAKRRTEGAAEWVRETFAEAGVRGSSGVVLAFHGNPFEDGAAFEPFLTALEEEVERFGRTVLAVHGDDHEYTVDHPLVRRATGRRLDNLTRLEVPGSPEVGWVRVVVTPGSAEPFAFDARVVPRWKYW